MMPEYTQAELVVFHSMWQDLHDQSAADPKWLTAWVDRLPESGPWKKHTKDMLRICPPDFSNFQGWASRFHDCMSFAVGKRPQKRIAILDNRSISKLSWSSAKGGRTGVCGGCTQKRIR